MKGREVGEKGKRKRTCSLKKNDNNSKKNKIIINKGKKKRKMER